MPILLINRDPAKVRLKERSPGQSFLLGARRTSVTPILVYTSVVALI
jgi:hypothetical protein